MSRSSPGGNEMPTRHGLPRSFIKTREATAVFQLHFVRHTIAADMDAQKNHAAFAQPARRHGIGWLGIGEIVGVEARLAQWFGL